MSSDDEGALKQKGQCDVIEEEDGERVGLFSGLSSSAAN